MFQHQYRPYCNKLLCAQLYAYLQEDFLKNDRIKHLRRNGRSLRNLVASVADLSSNNRCGHQCQTCINLFSEDWWLSIPQAQHLRFDCRQAHNSNYGMWMHRISCVSLLNEQHTLVRGSAKHNYSSIHWGMQREKLFPTISKVQAVNRKSPKPCWKNLPQDYEWYHLVTMRSLRRDEMTLVLSRGEA